MSGAGLRGWHTSHRRVHRSHPVSGSTQAHSSKQLDTKPSPEQFQHVSSSSPKHTHQRSSQSGHASGAVPSPTASAEVTGGGVVRSVMGDPLRVRALASDGASFAVFIACVTAIAIAVHREQPAQRCF